MPRQEVSKLQNVDKTHLKMTFAIVDTIFSEAFEIQSSLHPQNKNSNGLWQYVISCYQNSTKITDSNISNRLKETIRKYLVQSWSSAQPSRADAIFTCNEFFTMNPNPLLNDILTASSDKTQRKNIVAKIFRVTSKLLRELTISKNLLLAQLITNPSMYIKNLATLVQNSDLKLTLTLGDLLADETKQAQSWTARNFEVSSILLPFLSTTTVLTPQDKNG